MQASLIRANPFKSGLFYEAMGNIMIVSDCDKRGYTKLSNAILQDSKLSAPAAGLLWYLLSRPPEWTLTTAGIVASIGWGERLILSRMKELISTGYVERSKHGDGTFSYVITDKPFNFTQNAKTATRDIPKTLKQQTAKTADSQKGGIRKEVLKKERMIKEVINTGLPAVKENQSLHMSIQQAFISKVGKFTDYGKEGKAIKGLITKAENWAPDNPGEFMKNIITAYYEMRQTDKFFGKQPFLPSALNSSGIFDRVMVQFENSHKEIDPEIAAYYAERMAK